MTTPVLPPDTNLVFDVMDCLELVSIEYHQAAIVANDGHPAVDWRRCTDILCVRARETLTSADSAFSFEVRP